MLEVISREVAARIANPVFRRNAELYLDIEADYRAQVESWGLSIATEGHLEPEGQWSRELAARTFVARDGSERRLNIANDGKSLCVGWLSPSCVSCRVGVGTITQLISTQCPRDCFFCFNPNQANHEQLQHELADPLAQ
ncbi:MAG: hypothetical protein LBH64_00605, partial [Coriobacteriales bacterium]|nr:hypothetical protein [Coriobacteriales bacterium]